MPIIYILTNGRPVINKEGGGEYKTEGGGHEVFPSNKGRGAQILELEVLAILKGDGGRGAKCLYPLKRGGSRKVLLEYRVG